jgi:hypothetical protein
MYLSRLEAPGSPLPARMGLISPRHAATGKSPALLAGRAYAIAGGRARDEGAAAAAAAAAALTGVVSTGNLRRLASEAEFRSARPGDPQQPPLLRGATVGAQQQGSAAAGVGLGRAALRRHNSLVQERGDKDPGIGTSTSSGDSGGSGASSSRGGRGGMMPDPQQQQQQQPHPGYYHTIGPSSTLAQRASGTSAALSRVRKLAGAAMSREGSFLTALSLLGGEDSGGGGSGGGNHPPYASPPTAGVTWLGSPPIPSRSASVGSNDTGGFDPSSPPGVGMPLLSTSPAPTTIIMGPGARGPGAASSSSAAAFGYAGSGGSGGGGGGLYYPGGPGAAAGGRGGGGGGGAAGSGREEERVMAGLIADAREINELCRCVRRR